MAFPGVNERYQRAPITAGRSEFLGTCLCLSTLDFGPIAFALAQVSPAPSIVQNHSQACPSRYRLTCRAWATATAGWRPRSWIARTAWRPGPRRTRGSQRISWVANLSGARTNTDCGRASTVCSPPGRFDARVRLCRRFHDSDKERRNGRHQH